MKYRSFITIVSSCLVGVMGMVETAARSFSLDAERITLDQLMEGQLGCVLSLVRPRFIKYG